MSAPSATCATVHDNVVSECDDQLKSDNVSNSSYQPVLTLETMNTNLRAVQPNNNTQMVLFTIIRQHDRDLRRGVSKPFDRLYMTCVGDSQSSGQRPITFLRQVLALCTYPELLDNSALPEDAKQRARRILDECWGHSMGAYTQDSGMEMIRLHVATYITKRDGGIPSNFSDVVLCNGATFGIRILLNLLMTGRAEPHQAGVMIPVPQYSLYGMALRENNGYTIPYYLDEDNDWALNINELQRAIDKAKGHCIPRAIVVINPGNPTGQVLSKQNIADVIKFARKESLFIIADEVYQHNVYDEEFPFHSFKKVLTELGRDYSKIQLASLMSASKGFSGECGLRGGYMELINVDPELRPYINFLSRECPSTYGQVAVELVVNPPQSSEPSFDKFCQTLSFEVQKQEKEAILNGFAASARLTSDTFNSLQGIRCNQVRGAIYAHPRIFLPDEAISAAKAAGMIPDMFYCTTLLEETGIGLAPGSAFGQMEGTHHIRMTLMSSVDEQKIVLDKFKEFHVKFLARYTH